MSTRLKHKIQNAVFILTVAILTFGVSIDAIAQTPAATPCDPEYYKSLESRAWLEAQREITQNQNLIFKSDSVLEYTCFDKFLSHLAGEEPSLFSSGNGWSNASNNAQMISTLQDLVNSAVSSYLTGNFNHDFLGGQLTGVGYSNASVSATNYSCNIMKSVWETGAKTAKCRDFIVDPDYDGFYTFAEYQSEANGGTTGLGDRRHLPQQCSSIAARWDTEIKTALVEANTPWTEDNVVTYLDRLDPANCAASTNPPILTGLTVIRNELPQGYVEKVCITPGCTYDPAANNCAP